MSRRAAPKANSTVVRSMKVGRMVRRAAPKAHSTATRSVEVILMSGSTVATATGV